MEIFSKGTFYFGIDENQFTDIFIHIGIFRLEYGQNPPQKPCPNSEPIKKTGDRPPDS